MSAVARVTTACVFPDARNELHLDGLGAVHLYYCTQVTLPQSVLRKISVEDDCVKQMVCHRFSLGDAVMKRGVSSPNRTIQIVIRCAALPDGP